MSLSRVEVNKAAVRRNPEAAMGITGTREISATSAPQVAEDSESDMGTEEDPLPAEVPDDADAAGVKIDDDEERAVPRFDTHWGLVEKLVAGDEEILPRLKSATAGASLYLDDFRRRNVRYQQQPSTDIVLTEGWDPPPQLSIDTLQREVYAWDGLLAKEGPSASATDATLSTCLVFSYRGEDAVFRAAVRLIEEGRCQTRDDTLNTKQAFALLCVAEWLQRLKNKEWLNTAADVKPLRLVIIGGPGTGKTTTVNLCKSLIRAFLGEDTTQQCAFMHSAARLVGGETLNSALLVPIVPLSSRNKTLGERKGEMLHRWRKIVALFLDEISMISAELFGRGEFRSRQAKGDDTVDWGGLSVVASGDFAQKTPVNSTSLADSLAPPMDASREVRARWEQEHAEALRGRAAWTAFDNCVELTYSRRCMGDLKTILDEMLVPGGRLRDETWNALQARVVGYSFDSASGKVKPISSHEQDARLAQAPFNSASCCIGVLRHSIRVLKEFDHARMCAAQLGRRLLMVPASDRADSSSSHLRIPRYMYLKFVAEPNLTRTRHLSGVLPLCKGMTMVLEEKLCAELGVVRGCRCIVEEICFDELEPEFDDDPSLEPHVLSRVPVGLVLQVAKVKDLPDPTWVKHGQLGPGRFFLGRVRRTWQFLLKDDAHVDHLEDKRGNKFIPVERLQLPVSSAGVLTDYGLQGQTVPGIILDLKRPTGMSRDEHWLALFVLLSRAEELDNILIYRLARREHFEGGPPGYLLQEMQRLRAVEHGTLQRIDTTLASLQMQKLREAVTQPLLQAVRPRMAAVAVPSSVSGHAPLTASSLEIQKRRRITIKSSPSAMGASVASPYTARI